MKEEEIANLNPQEYFNYLEGINKKIIVELKTVANIDTAKDTDNLQNILIESSMALEHNIKNLLYFIDKCPIAYEQIVHYHSHFKEVVKIFFSTVQNLIKTAQALILNSCDYLTTSSFARCRLEAIKTIKNTMATCSNFEKLYYNPDLQLEDEVDTLNQQQQQKEQEQQQKEQEEYEQQQLILQQLKDDELRKQQQEKERLEQEQYQQQLEKERELERIRLEQEQQQQQQLEKERLEKEEKLKLLQQQQQQQQQQKTTLTIKTPPPTTSTITSSSSSSSSSSVNNSNNNTPTLISNTKNSESIIIPTLKTSSGELIFQHSNSNGNLSLSPKLPSSPGSPTLGKFTESVERVHNFDRGTANIILNMNKIKQISLNGNSEQAPEIVTAARVISENIAIISKELRYKTLGTNLSEHFVNVVQIARLAIKNKSDQFYQDQLELAIEKFNDTMRKIIYSVKSISKSSMNLRQFGVDEMGRSPSSTSSNGVISPEKVTSPNFLSERVIDSKLNSNNNINSPLPTSPLNLNQQSSSQSPLLIQQPTTQPQPPSPNDNDKQLKRKEKQHFIVLPKDINVGGLSSSQSVSPRLVINDSPAVTSAPSTPSLSQSQLTSTPPPPTTKPTLNDKQQVQDKQDNTEKQKTLGKLFSKLVHKKRTPLPGFDSTSSSPSQSGVTNNNNSNNVSTTTNSSQSNSNNNSPIETSPSIESPTITKSHSHHNLLAESLDISNSNGNNSGGQISPITHSNSFSCGSLVDPIQSVPHVSISSSTNQLNSSNSSLNNSYNNNNKSSSPALKNVAYSTPKKERSFTIGMVSGKHSCVVLETPRSKKLFQHESAKQILNIISCNFPSFEKEFQMQNSEVISNLIEQIGNVVKTYHDQVIGDTTTTTTTTTGNNYTSTPSDSGSPVLNSNEAGGNDTISPALRKLYENGSFENKEHTRSSIQSKISRKLGTIRKKGPTPFTLLNNNNGSSSNLSNSSNNSFSNLYNIQDDDDKSISGGANQMEIDASEHLINTSSMFAEEAIELVNKCFEASIIVNHSISGSDNKQLFCSTLDHLESMLQSSVNFGKIDPSSFCMIFLKNIKTYIPTMKSKGGKCDPTLVTAATKLFRHTILSNLDKSIHSLCHSVRVLAIQMTIIVISISAKPWDISSQLQLFASAKSFIDSLVSLLDAVENKIYISTNTNIQDDVEVPAIGDDSEDINIWDEPDGPSTFKIDWISDEGSKTGRYVPKAGTLNKLISALTQDNKHDISRYTKTFLLTYQSFTNPWKLMEKLIQRYNVPVAGDANERSDTIRATTQLRVVSFMQTWIEKNFNDFDDQLIGQLKEFRTRLLMDNNNDLAVILGGLIKKKVNERNQSKDRSNTNLLTFPELMIPDGQKSPTALFLLLNESEIARQLTLIDFNIFSKIQPTELLDQSWNRDSLKFKSPNVIEMINRANKFSFWVSSQILWQEDIEDRVRVFEKFILISKYLREMNNFNTLLAIFTGLNTAPILRLKKTFALLSPNSLAIYNNLEKLMNSSGSYKNYRSVSKTPPLLPYLPVILSDLTFMEDGNPDKINNGLINFQKRELICRVISEVQQCQQQTKYEFPVVEPIHTLLTELPSSTPSELYQLSLIREPRDSNSNSGIIGGGSAIGGNGGSNQGSISAGSNFLSSSSGGYNIGNNNGFDTLKKYYKN